MIFARKMPKFYMKIARKIFFPNLRAPQSPLPPSPTPMELLECINIHVLPFFSYFVKCQRINKLQKSTSDFRIKLHQPETALQCTDFLIGKISTDHDK